MIQERQFRDFSTGMHPVDVEDRGMVIDYNCTINCGGVIVHPGDIVFGDYYGVIVIPSKTAQEIITCAAEKVEGENITREERCHLATGL